MTLVEISHIGKNNGNLDLVCEKNESSHKISVVIAYKQLPLIIANDVLSSKATGPKFVLSFNIHPFFVHLRREGSDESVDMQTHFWHHCLLIG